MSSSHSTWWRCLFAALLLVCFGACEDASTGPGAAPGSGTGIGAGTAAKVVATEDDCPPKIGLSYEPVLPTRADLTQANQNQARQLTITAKVVEDGPDREKVDKVELAVTVYQSINVWDEANAPSIKVPASDTVTCPEVTTAPSSGCYLLNCKDIKSANGYTTKRTCDLYGLEAEPSVVRVKVTAEDVSSTAQTSHEWDLAVGVTDDALWSTDGAVDNVPVPVLRSVGDYDERIDVGFLYMPDELDSLISGTLNSTTATRAETYRELVAHAMKRLLQSDAIAEACWMWSFHAFQESSVRFGVFHKQDASQSATALVNGLPNLQTNLSKGYNACDRVDHFNPTDSYDKLRKQNVWEELNSFDPWIDIYNGLCDTTINNAISGSGSVSTSPTTTPNGLNNVYRSGYGALVRSHAAYSQSDWVMAPLIHEMGHGAFYLSDEHENAYNIAYDVTTPNPETKCKSYVEAHWFNNVIDKGSAGESACERYYTCIQGQSQGPAPDECECTDPNIGTCPDWIQVETHSACIMDQTQCLDEQDGVCTEFAHNCERRAWQVYQWMLGLSGKPGLQPLVCRYNNQTCDDFNSCQRRQALLQHMAGGDVAPPVIQQVTVATVNGVTTLPPDIQLLSGSTQQVFPPLAKLVVKALLPNGVLPGGSAQGSAAGIQEEASPFQEGLRVEGGELLTVDVIEDARLSFHERGSRSEWRVDDYEVAHLRFELPPSMDPAATPIEPIEYRFYRVQGGRVADQPFQVITRSGDDWARPVGDDDPLFK